MKKVLALFALMILFAQACAPSVASPTATLIQSATGTTKTASAEPTPVEDTDSHLKSLGGEPCPDSDEFLCVTLKVPYDHFNPTSGTLDVVFGVLPASGTRKGMFVVVTGGPGTSGLLSADDYTASFDASIRENFDIVFFDQRGVGLSGDLQCPDAATAFYLADWDTSTPEGEASIAQTAKTFAKDCVTEMGDPAYLPYLGTKQAVEDLDTFRAAMGVDKFWLYGESYGTQYAQTYAAAHPDHLAGLLLDGTVDLTLSGLDYYVSQAQAFNDTLVVTLNACNADPLCAADMGEDAVKAYDDLASQLKEAPLPFDFPLPSGGMEGRQFTFTDLETAASGYMYSETARMIFLRALAFYARDGDLAPLARVLYNSLSLDPETLEAIPDPSYSDAIYYGVECQDYAYPGATPKARAETYLRAGDKVDTSLPRFSSIFYGDLPCAFWPNASTQAERPAPFTADGIPTIVLNGTADPATPYEGAREVFSRLKNGYFVTETGGPHVIYGWGNSCVDDLVTAFLVADILPAHQVTCKGVVATEFVPLAPVNAADFESPLEALASVDDEIYYLPEYYYWDYETPTAVGCPFGGTMTFEPVNEGEKFTFADCAFSGGFVMNGEGFNNYEWETFTLTVTVSGLAEGLLTYTRDKDDNLSVTGEYGEQTINLSQ